MVTAEELRVRLGLDAADASEDGLISDLLAQAQAYVRGYCHLRPEEEIPDFLLAQMVGEDYDRLDGAGLSSRSVSGAAEYFRGTYSGDVVAFLRGMRHPGGRECGAAEGSGC